MEIGKTLYITDRRSWRAWLKKHHSQQKEIWLIYYKLNSGRKRIPYNDSVEEALCYGWIDSIIKPIDKDKFAQRFSPRRPGSQLSESNKERIRRLIRNKKMTAAGLAAVQHAYQHTAKPENVVIAPDILNALKKNKQVWINFRKFPLTYQRIRIGWIEMSRSRPQYFKQRLAYFIRMTEQNKRYGMVR
jgi:uncharacterized protein YdeI (YjbR/CyaY-like superfamily)